MDRKTGPVSIRRANILAPGKEACGIDCGVAKGTILPEEQHGRGDGLSVDRKAK